mgnify:CR=1 FL=1
MFLASKVYEAEIYVGETVMYGITLMSRPSDWEIIQQKEGKGSVFLNGNFRYIRQLWRLELNV